MIFIVIYLTNLPRNSLFLQEVRKYDDILNRPLITYLLNLSHLWGFQTAAQKPLNHCSLPWNYHVVLCFAADLKKSKQLQTQGMTRCFSGRWGFVDVFRAGRRNSSGGHFSAVREPKGGWFISSRWWFQIFFFTPTWGNDPIWRAYFQLGWNHQLVPLHLLETCPNRFFTLPSDSSDWIPGTQVFNGAKGLFTNKTG